MLQVAMLSLSLVNANPAANDVATQFGRWEQRLRSRIAALNIIPAESAKDPACNIVISFAIGANGRPGTATVRKSDCSPYYERAARQLVRNLGHVGAVPSLSGRAYPVVLKLSYGVAPTAAGDLQPTEWLEAERRARTGHNLRIVTTLRTAGMNP